MGPVSQPPACMLRYGHSSDPIMPHPILVLLLLLSILFSAGPASAQDKGSVNARPLPPLANPNDPKLGAKELFARKVLPAAMPTRVIGSYTKGCLAGAEQMPINGDSWQVMRLSRNRYWGHPDMIALLKRLAARARKDTGWPGILVGDIGQPRGGPALTGHTSHQIGLDADIWLTPMPDRRLSREDREEMSAVMMVRDDRLDVDPKVFTPGHVLLLRDAAQEPGVQRIFVNAAIKKALCREARGDRGWLAKIRPWWGHDYHFHIRMRCPPGQPPMRGAAIAVGGRRLQAGRSRLLVLGLGPASKTAAHTAEAEATDDAGAATCGLQGGAARAGREAITSSSSRLVPWSRNELLSRVREMIAYATHCRDSPCASCT